MKVIKNINNNVSLCLDEDKNEVVVFGRGVGFTKPPYEIDKSKIQRIYYNIQPEYIQVISAIPNQVIEISTKIIDYARSKMNITFSDSIVFTLADHINFAIKRNKENLNVQLPIIQDIEYFYKNEMEIGREALLMLNDELQVCLPEEEAAFIALHIINAEQTNLANNEVNLDKEIIYNITKMIEVYFHFEIDKKGFNYSRFVSHMRYLIQRKKENKLFINENGKLYETLCLNYPDTKKCVEWIWQYLKQTIECELTEEEIIYLMIHINRLCSREDCYQ